MNNRALILSLAAAFVAWFFVSSYVESIEEQASKKFGTEILAVKAKRDIREGETILETMLTWEKIPKKYLEPSAVYSESKEDSTEESKQLMKSLVGTVALVSIRKDEQVTRNKLTEPSIRTGLAPQVTPGKRAITVPVNDFTGVGKLIKPGDRVDLIVVLEMGGGKENKLAKTLLQDVVILAVGRNVTNNIPRLVEREGGKEKVRSLTEDFSFNSVTLEVDPAQAQTIALVSANGDGVLTLALRNNDDSERAQQGAVTLIDVLGADAARIQRAPAGGAKR